MNEEQIPETKRFRLQGDNEYIIGMAGALRAKVECDKPTFPYAEGEWCCHNPECGTWEVSFVHHDGVPSKAHCPTCLGLLYFQRYLTEELLLPVNE